MKGVETLKIACSSEKRKNLTTINGKGDEYVDEKEEFNGRAN
jgi:hypothetical protein